MRRYIRECDYWLEYRTEEDFYRRSLYYLENFKKYIPKEKIFKKNIYPNSISFRAEKQLIYMPRHYFIGLISCCEFDYTYTGLLDSYLYNDMSFLLNAIYQTNRISVLVNGLWSTGYDHSFGFKYSILGFACCDTDILEKLMPKKLGESKKGSTTFKICSNILMGLWYKDKKLLNKGLEQAKKRITDKKVLATNLSVIKYFIALAEKDSKRISEQLLEICYYSPMSNNWLNTPITKQPLAIFICPFVHGLYNLVYYIWGYEFFKEVDMPKSKLFIKDYSEFLIENNFKKGEQYMLYKEEFSPLNELINFLPEINLNAKDGQITDNKKFVRDILSFLCSKIDLKEHFEKYNKL